MPVDIAKLIDGLRSLPYETEYVEFKHSFSDFEQEGRDICALANAAAYHNVNFAYKIWGIDDVTHNVVGTDFKPRSKKKGNQGLEIWLRQHLSDNANFEFIEDTYHGLPVVVLRIWPAVFHPVRFKNMAYIRTDSSTQSLAVGSLRESELWKRIQREAFEDQLALESVSIENAFEMLGFGSYFDLLSVPYPTSLEEVLHYFEQDGLVISQDDGQVAITNLGAILFAKDFNQFPSIRRKALRIIRYIGKGRAGGRSEREFTSGYALCLAAAFDFINGMTLPVESIEGVTRNAQHQYPEVSLRELIVNSLIHQDFTIAGTGPMVEVFDNRIEVTNPGSLLVDVERIVNDPPLSRNEKLSALMRRLGFCEEAGSGWDKVISGCEELHLPAPRIEARQNVRVTLSQVCKFRNLTLDERLSACYWHACLKYGEGEYVSNASLRERFDVSESGSAQISRLIKEAVERGLIKPIDPETSPRYMRYAPYWA